MVFGPFWSEYRYIHFAYFGLEWGMVFKATTGAYERIYLSFQFQVNKKEIEIYKFEMHLKKFLLQSK